MFFLAPAAYGATVVGPGQTDIAYRISGQAESPALATVTTPAFECAAPAGCDLEIIADGFGGGLPPILLPWLQESACAQIGSVCVAGPDIETGQPVLAPLTAGVSTIILKGDTVTGYGTLNFLGFSPALLDLGGPLPGTEHRHGVSLDLDVTLTITGLQTMPPPPA